MNDDKTARMLEILDSKSNQLCQLYQECKWCPFDHDSEDDYCPLNWLIVSCHELERDLKQMTEARDMWLSQWRELERFVMDIKSAELWSGTKIEAKEDGMHYVTTVSEIETGEELMREVYGENWRM